MMLCSFLTVLGHSALSLAFKLKATRCISTSRIRASFCFWVSAGALCLQRLSGYVLLPCFPPPLSTTFVRMPCEMSVMDFNALVTSGTAVSVLAQQNFVLLLLLLHFQVRWVQPMLPPHRAAVPLPPTFQALTLLIRVITPHSLSSRGRNLLFIQEETQKLNCWPAIKEAEEDLIYGHVISKKVQELEVICTSEWLD